MFENQNKNEISGQIFLIPQENILPNPHQPRKFFDYNELESLSQSIQLNGILQPLTVRALVESADIYELISGERRLRAARMIGMTHLPCVIINTSDTNSAVLSLMENLQRQDLTFFEEAEAVELLIENHNLTQEQVAKLLGKAQSTLSNKLRLLKLPEYLRKTIEDVGLTERHARALLKLEDEKQQERMLNIILDRRLNVAQTEKMIEQMLTAKKVRIREQKPYKDVRIFINTIKHAVETMRKSGIEADAEKSETEEYIEYLVRIPKEKPYATTLFTA